MAESFQACLKKKSTMFCNPECRYESWFFSKIIQDLLLDELATHDTQPYICYVSNFSIHINNMNLIHLVWRLFVFKGEMHKKAYEHIWLHFFCFFWFLSFFPLVPPWKLWKKSSVSSDLNISFKQSWKKKHFLRVSFKSVENWKNGSQMCS